MLQDTVHQLSRFVDLHHRLNMELDLQSLFELLFTAVLIGWDPTTPTSSRIWAHIQGLYLSAKKTTSLCNPLIYICPVCVRFSLLPLKLRF
jgi:hypothetical protein